MSSHEMESAPMLQHSLESCSHNVIGFNRLEHGVFAVEKNSIKSLAVMLVVQFSRVVSKTSSKFKTTRHGDGRIGSLTVDCLGRQETAGERVSGPGSSWAGLFLVRLNDN